MCIYGGTPLIRTPMGQKKVSILVRCPHFRGVLREGFHCITCFIFINSLFSQSLAKLNESIPEYRYSLSLEPTSEPVLSVYSSVLCEIRKIDASMEYGRKLDETQVRGNI